MLNTGRGTFHPFMLKLCSMSYSQALLLLSTLYIMVATDTLSRIETDFSCPISTENATFKLGV